jgi:TRAP-type mannitol/chloroaromatic compound transport system permease large subunit
VGTYLHDDEVLFCFTYCALLFEAAALSFLNCAFYFLLVYLLDDLCALFIACSLFYFAGNAVSYSLCVVLFDVYVFVNLRTIFLNTPLIKKKIMLDTCSYLIGIGKRREDTL